jgi:hypothetical protein
MTAMRKKGGVCPMSEVGLGEMPASLRSRSPTGPVVLSATWPWAPAGLIAFALIGVLAVIITLSIVLG